MRRTTAEIQHVDAVRLTRDGTNNRMETIFKPPNRDISSITLKPSSPVLILKTHIILWRLIDMPPIVDRHSTNSQHTIDTPHIDRVMTGILAMYWPTCWLTQSQVLANTPFTTSVECRPTYRSTCRPIEQLRVNQYSANTLTDISADGVNQYSINGCTNYTRPAFSTVSKWISCSKKNL